MTDESTARIPTDDQTGPPAPELAVEAARRPTDASARIDPLIGTRLASYEIISRVARGGMGTVYRARHVYIDKIVAVKVLDPALAQRADLIERFRTEAQSLARVEHENVVKVIDILEDRGVHFIVMDFAEGVNLRVQVKEHGPLSPEDLLSVARQTAEALLAAHREGILHRDVKPENLIRNARGRCKLADFGLAGDLRLIAEGHEGPLNFGTPAYSAPEVLKRIAPDKRSDVFSFGATMYHLATGEPPFGQSGIQQILLRQKQGARPLAELRPDLPAKLSTLLSDCLSWHPRNRPETFAEIIERLPRRAHNRATGSLGTPTEPTDLLATASAQLPVTRDGSRRVVSIAVIALALAAALLVAYLAWQTFGGPTELTPQGANAAISESRSGPAERPAPAISGPSNSSTPAFLPEDEALGAAELDSRAAMARADYSAAWAAYAKFLKQHPASRHARAAQQKQRDIHARVGQLRAQEFTKACQASSDALAERRTADALAALDRFPQELLAPLYADEQVEVVPQLSTQRQVVIAAEASDLAALLKRADVLRLEWRENCEQGQGLPEGRRLPAAGNLLRERDLLDGFLGGRTPDAQGKVNVRLSALRKQLEASHQQAMVAPATWRLFCAGPRADWALLGLRVADEIQPLLADRKFEAARGKIDDLLQRVSTARNAAISASAPEVAARIGERAEVEDLLRKLRDDVVLAEKLVLLVQGALRRNRLANVVAEYRVHGGYEADKKRSTRIDVHKGRVAMVAQSDFEVETESGKVTLKFDLLTADTVRALIKPSISFDEHLCLVAWLVALGRAEATLEDSRIQRMEGLSAETGRRIHELATGARLAPAAVRRMAYMAAAAGRIAANDFGQAWGVDSIEARLLAARDVLVGGESSAAAAYIGTLREAADPELVWLETLAGALDRANAKAADRRLRVTLEPWDADARTLLARALAGENATEAARMEARRALLVDPSAEMAWTLLKELG